MIYWWIVQKIGIEEVKYFWGPAGSTRKNKPISMLIISKESITI